MFGNINHAGSAFEQVCVLCCITFQTDRNRVGANNNLYDYDLAALFTNAILGSNTGAFRISDDMIAIPTYRRPSLFEMAITSRLSIHSLSIPLPLASTPSHRRLFPSTSFPYSHHPPPPPNFLLLSQPPIFLNCSIDVHPADD